MPGALPATQQAALEWFDALAPADPGRLQGDWRGEEWPTSHPLDGLLAACGWHGKRIDGPEDVQPLVFRTVGGGTVCVRPLGGAWALRLVQRWPGLKSAAVGRLLQAVWPLLETRRPQARLRSVLYRGQVSAAIVYDGLPIVDVLRQVDPDTLLGLMDCRGIGRPWFFLLRRERRSSPAG